MGGICTIKGLEALEGSGTGRLLENASSLASCLALGVGAGDRSSNERRLGGSVVGRAGGGGLEFIFPVETGLGGDFSGLLGGVLKGEALRSGDAPSDWGARVFGSGRENIAGFAGIFGFDARLAGGGNEALFNFRSAGLPVRLGRKDNRDSVLPPELDGLNCGMGDNGRGGAGELNTGS